MILLHYFNYSANIMFRINRASHCVSQCILHSCSFKGVNDQRIASLNTLSVCQIHQNSHDTSLHYFNYSANIMFRINNAPHCVPQCILHSCFFKGVDDQVIGSLNTLSVCQIHKNSYYTSFQFFNYSVNIMFHINRAPQCVSQCILHSCSFKFVNDQRIVSLNTLSVCEIHQNSHDTSFHYFNYSEYIRFRINRAPHCVSQCILHSCCFTGVNDQLIASLNTLSVCQIHQNSHDTSFYYFNYSANIMFHINRAPHCVPQCILHSCSFKGVDEKRIGSLNTLLFVKYIRILMILLSTNSTILPTSCSVLTVLLTVFLSVFCTVVLFRVQMTNVLVL